MIRTVSGSFLSSLSSPGAGTMISQNLHAASSLAATSQHSQLWTNQAPSRLPSGMRGLWLAGSAVARWDHYQTWTQFANTRQTGYLWQRNWYAIITLTLPLTSEHDWGLQWQWQPGQAQQQRLASGQSKQCGGEDREMWNIETNSNPTSRQETLADPSDGANTSAFFQLHVINRVLLLQTGTIAQASYHSQGLEYWISHQTSSFMWGQISLLFRHHDNCINMHHIMIQWYILIVYTI